MKKTYQKPTIVMVSFTPNAQMLSASNFQTTVSEEDAPVDAEEIESRQSSSYMWTDD